MKDMTRLTDRICEELDKIAEKGLNTGNLETAYKLVDMYKDLKNTEYWDQKGEYYMAVLDEMQGGSTEYSERGYSRDGGYSERRHRDSMGRYSRNGGQMDAGYDGGSSYRRGYSRARDGYSRNGGDTYDRYMDSKMSYRDSKSPECKQRLMSTLEEHMDNFAHQMEEMLRDSDCQEERTTIRRYLGKIKNLA